MQRKILLTFLILFQVTTVAAQGTAAKKATGSKAPVAPVSKKNSDWSAFKQELQLMAAKFNDPKLSKDAKLALLPRSNMVLSDIQDLTLSPKDKTDQIRTVVEFMTASTDTDFANSNPDTLYFDYKAHKKDYTDEINKIKSKTAREEIMEAFKGLEEFERDAEKPESESDEE